MKVFDEGANMSPDDWDRIFNAIQVDASQGRFHGETFIIRPKEPIPSRLPGPMISVQVQSGGYRLKLFKGVWSGLWYLMRTSKTRERCTYAARYTTWEHARDAVTITLQTGVFMGHPMEHFQDPLMIVPPGDQPGA